MRVNVFVGSFSIVTPHAAPCSSPYPVSNTETASQLKKISNACSIAVARHKTEWARFPFVFSAHPHIVDIVSTGLFMLLSDRSVFLFSSFRLGLSASNAQHGLGQLQQASRRNLAVNASDVRVSLVLALGDWRTRPRSTPLSRPSPIRGHVIGCQTDTYQPRYQPPPPPINPSPLVGLPRTALPLGDANLPGPAWRLLPSRCADGINSFRFGVRFDRPLRALLVCLAPRDPFDSASSMVEFAHWTSRDAGPTGKGARALRSDPAFAEIGDLDSPMFLKLEGFWRGAGAGAGGELDGA